MNILQATALIIRRGDAQQSVKPLIPGTRQIRHRQLPGNQRLLQPKAQQHMRRVGHLIGFHPDKTALNMPQPRLQRGHGNLTVKFGAQHRRQIR